MNLAVIHTPANQDPRRKPDYTHPHLPRRLLTDGTVSRLVILFLDGPISLTFGSVYPYSTTPPRLTEEKRSAHRGQQARRQMLGWLVLAEDPQHCILPALPLPSGVSGHKAESARVPIRPVFGIRLRDKKNTRRGCAQPAPIQVSGVECLWCVELRASGTQYVFRVPDAPLITLPSIYLVAFQTLPRYLTEISIHNELRVAIGDTNIAGNS